MIASAHSAGMQHLSAQQVHHTVASSSTHVHLETNLLHDQQLYTRSSIMADDEMEGITASTNLPGASHDNLDQNNSQINRYSIDHPQGSLILLEI